MALLLVAAGFSAFAQAQEAASAPEAAASAPAPVAAPAKPRPATTVMPPVSALAAVPNWQSLTPTQRELLAPLAKDWDKLGPNQRSKWLNATPRLATLPEPELARLHERMRDWAYLTPAERVDARVSFQVAKQVDAEERQAKWEAYQALPPEKRQELADKAVARRQAKASAPTPKPPVAAGPKSNIVPAAPKMVTPVPVAGSLVQAKPGATTVLITRGLARPAHHAAGEAKVVADPSLVDPKTLLPKSLKAPPASAPRT
ncbi:hypothetical protein J2X20_001069 [Pelomonas saccharophila]|uniref:DUF3106 domain-containing protein n=1 Tax=Roseateles saccharophilus TaxID=304 RepID=A0ABU1YHX9_ROSSA|nr:DUF3106 domain-containing protein [Roseateles saccharophilus]MDR7268440.1 hypothetical protein [Roseateles saccharophilus]